MPLTGQINPVNATRQNHALEHATIALLLQRLGINTRIAGRATAGCFYVYGNLPTEMVEEAAHEALARMKNGERDLAVSPFCGTNIAVAGTLAGLVSMIALGNRNRMLGLPRVLVAAIGAVLAAQPLGRLVQKHLTTTPDLTNLHIAKVTKAGWGPAVSHKIKTVRRGAAP